MKVTINTKKLKSGFEIPVFGLGMWQMGGRWDADGSNDAADVAALQAALALGITHFDTAESYASGHSEELLGRAIKGRDRKKLLIVSKVSGSHQSYDGVHRAFEASLKRLGTDYIDLYLLHRYPDLGTHIADTMRAMDELVEQGLVRNIGVSNFTPNRFNEAQKYTKNKLVCNQVHYNVQYREIEHAGILKQCQDEDVMLVAYRPLQKGELLSSTLMNELAKKYNKTPNQVAINWLISQKNVVTIAKTSNLEHLKENLGSLDWTMDSEDIERIRSDYPDQKSVSDAVPLDYEADVKP